MSFPERKIALRSLCIESVINVGTFPDIFLISEAIQISCCRIATIFSVYHIFQPEFSLVFVRTICNILYTVYIEADFRYQMPVDVSRQGM
jgi:hypothetical protein